LSRPILSIDAQKRLHFLSIGELTEKGSQTIVDDEYSSFPTALPTYMQASTISVEIDWPQADELAHAKAGRKQQQDSGGKGFLG
jgi:hypothetical protein